ADSCNSLLSAAAPGASTFVQCVHRRVVSIASPWARLRVPRVRPGSLGSILVAPAAPRCSPDCGPLSGPGTRSRCRTPQLNANRRIDFVRLAPTPANGVSIVMRLMLIGIAAAAAIANASVPHGGGRGGSGIGSHSGHGAGGAHAGAVGRGCAGP